MWTKKNVPTPGSLSSIHQFGRLFKSVLGFGQLKGGLSVVEEIRESEKRQGEP